MWKQLCLALLSCVCASALTPQQLIVVYNADSALSEKTARTYCAKRGINVSQMVALRGVKSGDISRADFERKIKSPLLYAVSSHDWALPTRSIGGSREMFAIALMPDIPLRIQESTEAHQKRHQENLKRREKGLSPTEEWTPLEAACVDSELSLLGAAYPLRGGLQNPYFGKDRDIAAAKPPALAVCRIDGPDEACINRMIQDPLRVEAEGLWGWVVIDSGGPYPQGEKMFKAAAQTAKQHYQPLFHETSGHTLADSFPMMGQTAVYFGWYTEFANGPFSTKAAPDFSFAPGAIAGHLHSFSCPNLKDSARWAPALLKRGAAVSFGNVNEPFLGGCHDFGILYDRLLKGYTLGEAALMATPMLSWQEVTFGDPLYRPFAARKAGTTPRNAFAQWQELCRRTYARPDAMEPSVKAALGTPHAAVMAEAFALLCADDKKFSLAAEYFRLAGNAASRSADKLRNRLLQITALHQNKSSSDAQALMRQTLQDTDRSPYRAAVESTAQYIIPQEWAKMKQEEAKKASLKQ